MLMPITSESNAIDQSKLITVRLAALKKIYITSQNTDRVKEIRFKLCSTYSGLSVQLKSNVE
jgi:hypothetical protein